MAPRVLAYRPIALNLHRIRLAIVAHNLVFYAAASSLSAPRATILSALFGSGRCNALASSHGARSQTSRSSSVVRITGIAFGWIGSTTAFGAVVRKPRSEEDTSELQSPVPLVWRLFL